MSAKRSKNASLEKKQRQMLKDYFDKGFEAFPLQIILKRINGGVKKNLIIPFPWRKTSINREYAVNLLTANRYNAIALKTGQESNLFVLDIDRSSEASGLDFLNQSGITIPRDTPTVRTQSGGYHFYFRFADELKDNSTGSSKKNLIDWRGNGGIIIAPPTQINTDRKYEWVVPVTSQNLQRPPEKLVSWILEHSNSNNCSDCQEGTKTLEDVSPKQRALFEKLIKRSNDAQYGGRSENDFDLVAWGIKIGLSRDEIHKNVTEVGKFWERQDDYFNLTYKNALQLVNKQEGGK